MKTLYTIIGNNGEPYEDFTSWEVMSYLNREEAEQHLRLLRADIDKLRSNAHDLRSAIPAKPVLKWDRGVTVRIWHLKHINYEIVETHLFTEGGTLHDLERNMAAIRNAE